MGYTPPEPPPVRKIGEPYGVALERQVRIVDGIAYSGRDCEYCGTLIELRLGSRCPSCGAPVRRREPSEGGRLPRVRMVTE